jgi:hypothetical protein
MAVRSSGEVLRTSTLIMSAMLVSGLPFVVDGEIVERDHVPAFFQTLAGGNDQIVRFDAFQYLDDGVAGRQKGHIVLHIAGAVHEGASSVAEHVESHDQRTIPHDLGGGFGVFRTEIIFNAVAEQQFIAEDFFFFGKNGLAGDKAQAGPWRWLGHTRIGSGSRGVHAPFIGRSAEKVQARQASGPAR